MLADPRFQAQPEHRLGDYRGVLAAPMDRDGVIVGVIALSRPEPRRFTDRQVALVKAFADQAVIAINNVGLFNETQEALKQQTATADVLKVISRSAFDLQAVFDSLLGSAVALPAPTAACWPSATARHFAADPSSTNLPTSFAFSRKIRSRPVPEA